MARLATSSDQREIKNGILIPKNMKKSTVSPDGTAVDTTSDKVEQIIRAILDEGRSKEERQELLEAFLKKVDTEMSEAKTQMSEKQKEDQKLQAEKDKKIADLMAALNDTKKEKDGEIANLKAKRTKERDEIAKEFREYKKRGAQKAEQAAESKYKAAFEKAEAQRNAKLKKKLEEIELRGPNPKLRDFLPFSEVRALRKIDDQIIKCKQEHPEEYPSNAITYLSKMTQSRGGKRVLKIAKENQLK
ncbi:hypothetical protein J5893_00945 [bacterium]|nr:hypothetical protein [bacterium]